MNKKQLQKRFQNLSYILKKSRGLGYFNALQRICLHMERSSILHAQNQKELDNVRKVEQEYTIPYHLERKCQQVLKDFYEPSNKKCK